MTRPWFVMAALAASAALLPLTVGAQAPSDNAPPPYRPSLADLMTTTVQPRHVKLAFAGREKNWVFAAYELKQLTDAFDRLSIQWPQWRQQGIVELVETIVRDPLFDLDIAIKNKDDAKFAEGYRQLTDACNACHQAALQTPIVIQDPKEAMFPDQDFRPKQ
jgi:predicted secreted protein